MQRFYDMFPFMLLPVGIYSLFAGISSGSRGVDVFVENMEKSNFVLTMPSGAPWGVSGGDLLVAFSLIILFIELIRGVASSKFAIIHHTLAVLMALGSIVLFLSVESYATTTFFLIMIMCVLDMIGGIIVNIAESGGGFWNGED